MIFVAVPDKNLLELCAIFHGLNKNDTLLQQLRSLRNQTFKLLQLVDRCFIDKRQLSKHILFINRFSALLFCIERCDNLALFELFFVRENIGQRNIIEFAQDSFLNGILQRKLKNYFSNFIQQEIISSLIVLTLWRSAQPEAISIRREPARKIFDKSIRTSSMYFVKNKQRIIAIIAR